MKKYFSLLVVLCLAVSFAVAPIGINAASQLGASAIPDHIILTWVQDPASTQTITWRTDTTLSKSIVQFAKANDNSNPAASFQAVNGTVDKLSSDLGDMNLHTVTLSGLEAGTKYSYRVGDGYNWSDYHTFITEVKDTKKFKFLVFGDSQSGDAKNPEYGPWKTTIQNAFNSNTDAKFFINMGDLVEIGQYYTHWNNWFDSAKGVIETIPAMPVQGNHETYSDASEGTTVKPSFFTNQFKVPQNGPDGLKGQTYSFDYGNIHIVMLDSQEDEEASINGSILNVQKKWLENDLSNTKQQWKIVCFHKTPYYNKATRTNEIIKEAFQPIFDKYHVDVVFNGHDHGISRTYPINNDKFVDSPSKGTVYYVTGRSGNKYYKDLSQKVWDVFFYDPQDEPNYISAEVDESRLTIKAIKQDGTLIDAYTIDKSTDKDSPQTIVPPKCTYTRLVIFGNVLQQPFLPTLPKQIDGKWYVPTRAFIEFIGGNVTWLGNDTISLNNGNVRAEIKVNDVASKLNNKETTLPDAIKTDSGNTMISADDLNALFGFTYKYDEETNMLMLQK